MIEFEINNNILDDALHTCSDSFILAKTHFAHHRNMVGRKSVVGQATVFFEGLKFVHVQRRQLHTLQELSALG